MIDNPAYLQTFQKYLDLRASHMRSIGGNSVERCWDIALVPPSFEADSVESLVSMIHHGVADAKISPDAPRGVQQALHVLNNPTLCKDLEQRARTMALDPHPSSLFNVVHSYYTSPTGQESGWSDPSCPGTFCAVVDHFNLKPSTIPAIQITPLQQQSFRLTSAVYQTFRQTGDFIADYKYWILAPVVGAVITAGVLLMLGQSKGIATIYTLF